MSKRIQYALSMPELATTPTAETDRALIYGKTDHRVYGRTSDGLEYDLSETRGNTHLLPLKRFRQALARTASEACDVLVIGQSISEGYYAPDNTQRWQNLVAGALQRRYNPPAAVGGEGYVPALHTEYTGGGTPPNGYTYIAERWTYGGGWARQADRTYGLGRRAAWLDAAGETATITFTGDRFWLHYVRGSSTGAMTVTIDGGAPTTVDTYLNTALAEGFWDSGALAVGSHTVVVTCASGGAVPGNLLIVLDGIMLFNGDGAAVGSPGVGAGVRWWDSAHSGYKAADFNGAGGTATSAWALNLPQILPDLVIIETGNEWLLGSTLSAGESALGTLIDFVRSSTTSNPSVVLNIIERITSTTNFAPAYAYDDYAAMVRRVAIAKGCGVLHMGERVPDAPGTGGGTGYADNAHPNADGHKAWAEEVLDYLIGDRLPIVSQVFRPFGSTGATAQTRYMGGTATGAPVSGTYQQGDWVIAQNGHVWICTATGSPGTWTDASAGGGGGVTSVAGRSGVVTLTAADIAAGSFPTGTFNFTGTLQEAGNRVYSSGNANLASAVVSETAFGQAAAIGVGTDYARGNHTHGTPATPVTGLTGTANQVTVSASTGAVTLSLPSAITTSGIHTGSTFAPTGLTGATQVTRYVGGVATVAPTTGTFAVGDWVVGRNGTIWICQIAGSPGTWSQVGPVSLSGTNTWTGAQTFDSAKMSAGGVATSTTSYGSNYFRLVSSFWNGSAAQDSPISLAAVRTSTALQAEMYLDLDASLRITSGSTHACLRLEPYGSQTTPILVNFGGSPIFTLTTAGVVQAPIFSANATGAAARLVGRTAGAPTGGTWAYGDVATDTASATVWFCTTGGTPGTWTQIGSGGVTSAVAGTGIAVSAATGAVTFSNTGVTGLTAGYGVAVSGTTGSVTVSTADLASGQTFAAANTTYTDLKAYSGYVTTGNGWPVNGFLSGYRNGSAGTQRLQSEATGSTWARYWTGAAWSAFSLYADSQDYSAKGGLQVGTASNTYAELPASATNGQAIITDSSQTTGLRYASLIEPYVFSISGSVPVLAGKSRIYMEANYVVESVRASVNTAPTGATLIVDVNKNGTTIYTTQSNRPTVAVSTNSALGGTPDVTAFAAGDYLTVDVDQVGSGSTSQDLTVVVRMRRV